MAPIRHIEFWISDFRECLDFYKELFATLEWTQVDANGFEKNGTKIYFREHGKIEVASVEKYGPRHICFQAEDEEIVNAIANIPAVKRHILHGPGVLHPSGSYMLVFKDLDGYVLEVACKN